MLMDRGAVRSAFDAGQQDPAVFVRSRFEFESGAIRVGNFRGLMRENSRQQQAAARSLGFSVRKTMTLAQRLYEGRTVGGLGTVGLITYMRTDGVTIVPEAVASIRRQIEAGLGRPVEGLFSWLDPVPAASASIAQVHRARTHAGRFHSRSRYAVNAGRFSSIPNCVNQPTALPT